MEVGTYIGTDGRTYRWTKESHWSGASRWVIRNDLDERSFVSTEDWPAAKSALDALIEAEAGEWVELDSGCLRITKDGSDWEVIPEAAERLGNGYFDLSIDGYRKGRSVALEQVRELAEAVQSMPDTTFRNGVKKPEVWRVDSRQFEPFQDWAVRVIEAAKKVSQ